MRNKVLYFPHIDVPQSAWLTQTLLYWDEVGVIMPYQYVEEPEQLEPYTRELVEANLLTQVIPSDYLADVPNFADAFLAHLTSRPGELEARRGRYQARRNRFRQHGRDWLRRVGPDREIHLQKIGVMPIHSDKTSDLASALIDIELAERMDSMWLSVESTTGLEFMSYLAGVLGKHPSLQFAPVTDDRHNLVRFVPSARSYNHAEETIAALRLEILNDLLPSPFIPPDARAIEQFKLRHGHLLSSFRRNIEMELTRLADMSEGYLRARQMQLLKEGFREEVEEITRKMEEHGWPHIVFGQLCALLGPIPGIGTIPSILNAIYSAFGSGEGINTRLPLAYAAHARRELLGR